ncbi:MAG: hypothetical protein BWK79_17690 [Beggiatoa sp. IS2]|nr:MAG: hypothetical protein BWK79_17690 [Beggiatoa sp. IS2]
MIHRLFLIQKILKKFKQKTIFNPFPLRGKRKKMMNIVVEFQQMLKFSNTIIESDHPSVSIHTFDLFYKSQDNYHDAFRINP